MWYQEEDLPGIYRTVALALAHEVESMAPPADPPDPKTLEDDERALGHLAAIRLVHGEVLRRDWPGTMGAEVRALTDEIDGAVQRVMRARCWGGEGEPNAEALVLSWLLRRGPRRFYAHARPARG